MQTIAHKLFYRCIFAMAAALAACALTASRAETAQPKAFAWVEAETPLKTNLEFEVSKPKAHLLSGGAMLLKAVTGKDIQQVPAQGYSLAYELRVPQAGRYEVWLRVAWEGVRAPFRWRIAGGEWADASPQQRSTNVMALGNWFEIAWLRLGDADLPAGAATIEIHYPKVEEGQQMLIGLDCLALTKGRFVPEGKLKPGQRYDGEIDGKAADQVYELPEPPGPADRCEVTLTGAWQVARYDDPDMAKDRFEPVSLPDPDDYPLRWMGVDVPGSLWKKDEMVFGHRLVRILEDFKPLRFSLARLKHLDPRL
jgi:hypothetical protein